MSRTRKVISTCIAFLMVGGVVAFFAPSTSATEPMPTAGLTLRCTGNHTATFDTRAINRTYDFTLEVNGAGVGFAVAAGKVTFEAFTGAERGSTVRILGEAGQVIVSGVTPGECPPPPAADDDEDGVPDDGTDKCLGTPFGEPVDAKGCSASQRDSDNDGVTDAIDKCPGTPAGTKVDASGCPVVPPPPPAADDDEDGVPDDGTDKCLGTPFGEPVDAKGCSASQRDSDNDGVTDAIDKCPGTPAGTKVDASGCPVVPPPPPAPTKVTPTAPTSVDKCGTTNDSYTIPSKDGVVYKVGGSLKSAGTYPGSGSVTVTAYAVSDKFVLEGQTSWELVFTDVACDTPPPTPPVVPPVVPPVPVPPVVPVPVPPVVVPPVVNPPAVVPPVVVTPPSTPARTNTYVVPASGAPRTGGDGQPDPRNNLLALFFLTSAVLGAAGLVIGRRREFNS